LPAVICEGEKKCLSFAHCLKAAGEAALVVGIAGIDNWRGTVGKETAGNGKKYAIKGAMPDLSLLEWQGRDVYIIFDALNSSAPNYHKSRIADRRAKRELAAELRARGAVVRVLEMPDETASGAKGIDDLLRVWGAERVLEWFRQGRANTLPQGQRIQSQGITFELQETGVMAIDDLNGGMTQAVFVCSPLAIEADTCDENEANCGRLLSFVNQRGSRRTWAMPMELLAGDGQEYRRELLSQGVILGGRKARELLAAYLSYKPSRQAVSVSHSGRYRGSFILQDQTIGAPDGLEIHLQSLQSNWLARTCGTLEEWRSEVSHYCQKNSRLAFAVSVGFAAPLLEVVQTEGGGFHFRGKSGTGKSTTQLVGGSVWGGSPDKGYLLRWRATSNGLEAVCAMHNDSLLNLDELAELDAREAGEVAYMVANGQGKLRMSKGLGLRRPFEWRLLFLSSGEISLSSHVETAQKRLRDGQEVRLVDLEADAGKGFGLFEELHGFTDGDALARHLGEASKRYYGTAIRDFLRQLVADREKVRAEFKIFLAAFRKDNLQDKANEQASRVCNRFALVAYAGKLASEYGITGWTEPEAETAAAALFQDWLSRRGVGSSDDERIIRQVRKFIEENGDARFRRIGAGMQPDERTIINRAGYLEKDSNDTATYYFSRETFRQTVCAGFDHGHAAKVLKERGWLLANHGYLFKRRDPESGAPNAAFYALTSGILDAE
jgi:putative DNA primase/helicase